MPSHASYTRLPTSPSPLGALEPLEYDDNNIHGSSSLHQNRSFIGVSESAAWRFFIATCVVALALSAANISYLSTSTTLQVARGISVASRSPPSPNSKRPSVYLGLENVKFEQSYCRSRGTFPKSFFTYDTREGPHAKPRHVHAPDDKMTLKFGGPIRTVVDFYIPDHGLENCTLSVRRYPDHGSSDGASSHANAAANIDVYLVPSPQVGDRDAGVMLDTLAFVAGRESTSKPFHCPGRSHVFCEWRCSADDCEVVIPLEGVTSLTASGESLTKTGFRITQYEAVDCIPRPA